MRSLIRKLGPVYLAIGLCVVAFVLVFWAFDLDRSALVLGLQLIGLVVVLATALRLYLAKLEAKEEATLEALEAEIHALNVQRMEERDAIQAYFLTWIHQIKTPITAAQLISRKPADELDTTELRAQLLYVEDYANMAMSYLKLWEPSSDLDIREVTLDQLLRPLFKKYAILFIHQRLSLAYEALEVKVITDSRSASVLIEQVLSNAIKYTEKGTIGVRLEAGALVIEDTGVGIRASDLPRIFDRGYSGFNGRLQDKATGLGLFLARELAERLGLEIEIASEEGKGTRVEIRGWTWAPPSNLTAM